MVSFSESLVVDVISRRASVLFPVDLWFKSSLGEFVVFDVNSSLTGSAEDDFRSLDELTDGEVLTLAAWCGVDVDGARPLAAWAYENAGRAGLVVLDIMYFADGVCKRLAQLNSSRQIPLPRQPWRRM